MPTLADIYSAADSLKRRLADTMANPATSLQQMIGYGNDRARAFNQQGDAALSEWQNTKKLNGPQQMDLSEQFASGYNPVGMTVWHGSPYKFKAFDASKIGTGEGAQAYGHGLYVAENPEVAKDYQEKLSSTGGAKRLLSNASNNVDAAIVEAQRKINHYQDLIASGGGGMMERAQHFLQMSNKNLDDLTAMKQGLPENKGAFYKINLPDEHIDKMLDYDAPLKSQPDVLAKIRDSIDDLDIRKSFDYNVNKGISGANAYMNYVPGKNNVERSQTLRNLDIPGIKYLDQTSRDAQDGTRNFVIFPGNEHMLQIQDINGNPIND